MGTRDANGLKLRLTYIGCHFHDSKGSVGVYLSLVEPPSPGVTVEASLCYPVALIREMVGFLEKRQNVKEDQVALSIPSRVAWRTTEQNNDVIENHNNDKTLFPSHLELPGRQ